ncbi:hypothetical protein H1235_17455 [Pseudoxanthomonas sp. NC8]|nr:hypothetical protein H1235_17455 [Pseudoxanthomonas sp. NC8]
MSSRDRKDPPPPGAPACEPEAPHERLQRKEHESRNQGRGAGGDVPGKRSGVAVRSGQAAEVAMRQKRRPGGAGPSSRALERRISRG